MVAVLKPCVAGQFYPADPAELQKMIGDFLAKANKFEFEIPKAIIVPHAGYIYSGQIAATAYAILTKFKEKIKKVVLVGPAHRASFAGIAATTMDFFETPLGQISVDKNALEPVLSFPFVSINDIAYSTEHSLEVQLPFLQIILSDFKIVPFLVGDADPFSIAKVLTALWGEDDTLIVISSDLSHYYDYDTAKSMDLKVAKAIEELKPEKISVENACGRLPIQGLLIAAKEFGLNAKILDVRNSGDTAGSKDRVVGYGAFYFG